MTYGELIGGKNFMLKLDPTTPPEDPSDYKLVGKPTPRRDIAGKVLGDYMYIHNFRIDSMLYGSVIRPPALGAKLKSVDEASIKDIPGVIKVVRDGDFLGVLTDNEWSAVRAARELKATWSKSETLPDEKKLWDHVRSTKIVKDDVTSNIGDVATAMAAAGKKLSGYLRFCHPYPRLDRAVLRDFGIQGRQAHVLVGIASHP